jgi:hypothetical protein
MLHLETRCRTERDKFQQLLSQFTELQQRHEVALAKMRELERENKEGKGLHDAAEKKAVADNLRISRMLADVQEKYSQLLVHSAEQQRSHADQVQQLKEEMEQQLMSSSAGRTGDAVQVYRAKLLAQQEEIRQLKDELATRRMAPAPVIQAPAADTRPVPAAVAAPKPLMRLSIKPPEKSASATMRSSLPPNGLANLRERSPYGSLLGSSSEEESSGVGSRTLRIGIGSDRDRPAGAKNAKRIRR